MEKNFLGNSLYICFIFLKLVFIYFCVYFCLGCVFVAVRAFSLVAASRGFSLIALCGLFIAVASLVAEPGL